MNRVRLQNGRNSSRMEVVWMAITFVGNTFMEVVGIILFGVQLE